MSFKKVDIVEIWRDDHLLGRIYDDDLGFEVQQDSYDIDELEFILEEINKNKK